MLFAKVYRLLEPAGSTATTKLCVVESCRLFLSPIIPPSTRKPLNPKTCSSFDKTALYYMKCEETRHYIPVAILKLSELKEVLDLEVNAVAGRRTTPRIRTDPNEHPQKCIPISAFRSLDGGAALKEAKDKASQDKVASKQAVSADMLGENVNQQATTSDVVVEERTIHSTNAQQDQRNNVISRPWTITHVAQHTNNIERDLYSQQILQLREKVRVQEEELVQYRAIGNGGHVETMVRTAVQEAMQQGFRVLTDVVHGEVKKVMRDFTLSVVDDLKQSMADVSTLLKEAYSAGHTFAVGWLPDKDGKISPMPYGKIKIPEADFTAASGLDSNGDRVRSLVATIRGEYEDYFSRMEKDKDRDAFLNVVLAATLNGLITLDKQMKCGVDAELTISFVRTVGRARWRECAPKRVADKQRQYQKRKAAKMGETTDGPPNPPTNAISDTLATTAGSKRPRKESDVTADTIESNAKEGPTPHTSSAAIPGSGNVEASGSGAMSFGQDMQYLMSQAPHDDEGPQTRGSAAFASSGGFLPIQYKSPLSLSAVMSPCKGTSDEGPEFESLRAAMRAKFVATGAALASSGAPPLIPEQSTSATSNVESSVGRNLINGCRLMFMSDKALLGDDFSDVYSSMNVSPNRDLGLENMFSSASVN